MAKQTSVVLIDDVDGGEADETVTFGLDGASYEIDLSGKNADALREALYTYIERGRRLSGRRTVKTPVTKAFTRTQVPAKLTVEQRKSIQKFAAANGFAPVAERGRIAAATTDAWEAAGRPA